MQLVNNFPETKQAQSLREWENDHRRRQ